MSVPYVIEKGDNNQERVYDLYSKMLTSRIIFIKGPFDQNMADSVTAQLLYLESVDQDEDVRLYVNSPGGHVDAMFAIYDVMNYIKPDVSTIGMGTCASAASFILASGAKGKRFVLPSTQIMIHELSGGNSGKFNDMKVAFEHTQSLYDKMAKHYVDFTGQKLAKIKKDMERDFYMSAEEAKKYGLVDEIFYKRD